MRGFVVLLTGCIVLGAVGVLAKEEESGRSVLAQILREVPSESGRFDVSQEVRLEKLFVELVRRIKSGDETLRSQIQFAEYVLKYKDALRRSFPDAYVDGLFVFEAVNISEVWKTFVRQDGYDIIADESVENSSEMQIEDANRVAGSGHERRRYTDLDNLFGPSKNKETSKALSRFTALRIEFLHSLPTGDVRILLNDVPFKSARFISPYVLEAFIPAEIIADDWTYSSSYVEVIVDDDTVSWIPLRDLIKEKERRKFMDQIHETQKHFNASVERTVVNEVQDDNKLADVLFDDAMVALNAGNMPNAMEKFQFAAKEGHDGALATLAMMHLSGHSHLRQDVSEGVKLLRQATEAGNADAQAIMAMLHGTGWASEVVEEDKGKEHLYLTFGAKGGSTFALAALAYRYLYGINVKKSCGYALHFYTVAATELLPDADEIDFRQQYIDLDAVYLSDGMRLANYDHQVEMFKLFERYAEQGDIEAQLHIGSQLVQGADGIPRNVGKARELLERASQAGNAHATAKLGYLHYVGAEGPDGIVANNATALKYFQAAAEKDDPFAINALGICYARGIGVEKDPHMAASYFRKAISASKYIPAYYNMGLLYLKGEGVPRKIDMAVANFQNANGGSDLYAVYQLVRLKSSGHSVMSCVNAAQNMKMVVEQKLTTQLGDVALEAYRSGDYELALYRYLQAAFLGDLMAQFNAAFLIERGLGVRGSMVGNEVASALALYRLSSDQGNKRATLEIGNILYSQEDYEEAFSAYRQAGMGRSRHPEAVFNMGMMHMTGRGVPMDYFMAKRYFDSARELSMEAKVPASIALYVLNFCLSRREYCSFLVELSDYIWYTFHGQDAKPPSLENLKDSLKSELESHRLSHLLTTLTNYWDLAFLVILVLILLHVLRKMRQRGGVQEAQVNVHA